MPNQKKVLRNKTIGFKMPEKVKDEFFELCKENHTDPSHELSQFVYNKIKEYKTNEAYIKRHESN